MCDPHLHQWVGGHSSPWRSGKTYCHRVSPISTFPLECQPILTIYELVAELKAISYGCLPILSTEVDHQGVGLGLPGKCWCCGSTESVITNTFLLKSSQFLSRSKQFQMSHAIIMYIMLMNVF